MTNMNIYIILIIIMCVHVCVFLLQVGSIPVARRGDVEAPHVPPRPWHAGGLTNTCTHCGARLFDGELSKGRSV